MPFVQAHGSSLTAMDGHERSLKLASSVSGSSSDLKTPSSMDTERVAHPLAMQRKAPKDGDLESPKMPYQEVRRIHEQLFFPESQTAATVLGKGFTVLPFLHAYVQ